MQRQNGSIADVSERDLAEWLAADPLSLQDLLGVNGIASDARPFTSVSLSGLPGQPEGDVDILLVAPGRPHEATAIEVKRIKYGADALRMARPNKLAELPKALRQTQKLASVGFWQVYLYAFVVIDSRGQNDGPLAGHALTSLQDSPVAEALSSLRLPDRVGLIRYDFVQPTDRPPLPSEAGGTSLVRLAHAVEQTPAVTEWVSTCCLTMR